MKYWIKLTALTTIGVYCLFVPTAALAQSAFTESGPQSAHQQAEAKLSMKIPFGSAAALKTSTYDARLSFSVDRYSPQTRGVQSWQLRSHSLNPTEITLTLSQEPILSFNGQEYNVLMDEEYGLSKGTKSAGKAALVVGAVTAVVVAGLLIRVAACGGDGEDEKC